jgi:hypothetical protein
MPWNQRNWRRRQSFPYSPSMPNTVRKSLPTPAGQCLAAVVFCLQWYKRKVHGDLEGKSVDYIQSWIGLLPTFCSCTFCLTFLGRRNIFKVSRHEAVKTLLKRADLDWRTCHRRNNKDVVCSQCLIGKARYLKVGVQVAEKFVSPNHFPAPPSPVHPPLQQLDLPSHDFSIDKAKDMS